MIIMGVGINYWFNLDMIYCLILNLVMLCGC